MGPFVTALEYGLDIKAELFGKPSPVFFHTALSSLSSDGEISADEVSSQHFVSIISLDLLVCNSDQINFRSS